jgi:DNA modification methylase
VPKPPQTTDQAESKPAHKPSSVAQRLSDANKAKARALIEGKPIELPADGLLHAKNPDTRIYLGDCRQVLLKADEIRNQQVDLIFADPPFNWNRDYDRWKLEQASAADQSAPSDQTWDDSIPREDYLSFTYDWLDVCLNALKPTGSLFVNIPDDSAAEIVCYLKGHLARKPARTSHMINWCIWHYRFGQNRNSAFISSKVHVLYFALDPAKRTWNPQAVLEPSDRATTYNDPRTQSKSDGMPPGLRVPLDVWYGPFMGRVQGNNAERRAGHDNQLPEAYLNRVIQCASNQGDLVVDPFVGSGTTATVARALKRRFIGSEFSHTNAQSAWDRITNVGMIRSPESLRAAQLTAAEPRQPRKARKPRGK